MVIDDRDFKLLQDCELGLVKLNARLQGIVDALALKYGIEPGFGIDSRGKIVDLRRSSNNEEANPPASTLASEEATGGEKEAATEECSQASEVNHDSIRGSENNRRPRRRG